ncbi:MAG TPA: hypothetical protein PKJ41_13190, partial [Bryobacteraceae bacterium]|nr:hypothetical protein [Bryobacteraceae bacterium]
MIHFKKRPRWQALDEALLSGVEVFIQWLRHLVATPLQLVVVATGKAGGAAQVTDITPALRLGSTRQSRPIDRY